MSDTPDPKLVEFYRRNCTQVDVASALRRLQAGVGAIASVLVQKGITNDDELADACIRMTAEIDQVVAAAIDENAIAAAKQTDPKTAAMLGILGMLHE